MVKASEFNYSTYMHGSTHSEQCFYNAWELSCTRAPKKQVVLRALCPVEFDNDSNTCLIFSDILDKCVLCSLYVCSQAGLQLSTDASQLMYLLSSRLFSATARQTHMAHIHCFKIDFSALFVMYTRFHDLTRYLNIFWFIVGSIITGHIRVRWLRKHKP